MGQEPVRVGLCATEEEEKEMRMEIVRVLTF
jgi:hypothetical protein